jgi:hypothetical protein
MHMYLYIAVNVYSQYSCTSIIQDNKFELRSSLKDLINFAYAYKFEHSY